MLPRVLFQFLPKRRQFSRSEIRQNPAIHVNHRRERLIGQAVHLVVCLLVRYHVENFVLNSVLVEPIHRLGTPAAKRFDEQSDFLGLIHLVFDQVSVVRGWLWIASGRSLNN